MSPTFKTEYRCKECGHLSPRWEGRCPICDTWGNYELVSNPSLEKSGRIKLGQTIAATPIRLGDEAFSNYGERISVGKKEIDRLLGGGMVAGSVLLMAGEPGIGKSTLLLQIAAHWATSGLNVLYVSGEESGPQVRLRGQRLEENTSEILFMPETQMEGILDHLQQIKPQALVVDSVQTLNSEHIASPAGSINQIRENTQLLVEWAKQTDAPLLISGHVTKDGTIAGPRVLEHMVDVVLYLEGDSLRSYRFLHSTKNRFGSTNDVALLEMRANGLREIDDPSAAFIGERQEGVPGSAVIANLEGTRPILAEVQALTSHSAFTPPRRTTTGIDLGRLAMITAVLSKRLNMHLGNQDIIVNIPGGLKINEPAADLGMALAITSSLKDAVIDPSTVIIGEVGLNGEIRQVAQLERRIAEAERHGFTRAIVPKLGGQDYIGSTKLTILPVNTLLEAANYTFSSGWKSSKSFKIS